MFTYTLIYFEVKSFLSFSLKRLIQLKHDRIIMIQCHQKLLPRNRPLKIRSNEIFSQNTTYLTIATDYQYREKAICKAIKQQNVELTVKRKREIKRKNTHVEISFTCVEIYIRNLNFNVCKTRQSDR